MNNLQIFILLVVDFHSANSTQSLFNLLNIQTNAKVVFDHFSFFIKSVMGFNSGTDEVIERAVKFDGLNFLQFKHRFGRR